MTVNVSVKDVESRLRSLRKPTRAGFNTEVLTAIGLVDGWTTVGGPTGELFVAHNPNGISALAPAADIDEFRSIHESRADRQLGVESPLPERTETLLHRTLETGKLGNLPVDLSGLTEFQQAVLRKTAEIPPGELRSYGWIAREIGKPGAVRAVGSALNRNPVPVVFPCHRVGRSDGSIGEYAFGAAMKRDLLRGEGADPEQLDALAEQGVRLTGTTTTKIYCFPTCRHARRTKDEYTVGFRSPRAAAAAGYRACKVCRPAAA